MSHPRVIRIIPIGVVMICARPPPNSVDPVIHRRDPETHAILPINTSDRTAQKMNTRIDDIIAHGRHITRSGMPITIPGQDNMQDKVPTIISTSKPHPDHLHKTVEILTQSSADEGYNSACDRDKTCIDHILDKTSPFES